MDNQLIKTSSLEKFTEKGDCFQASFNLLMELNDVGANNALLVHGLGILPNTNKQFAHAWVEVGDIVYDYSNGKEWRGNKEKYYKALRINYTHKYDILEVIKNTYKMGKGVHQAWDDKIINGDGKLLDDLDKQASIKKIARAVRQDMSLPILRRLVDLGYDKALWNIHETLHVEPDICDFYNGEVFDLKGMISNLEHEAPIFEKSHVNCFKDDVEVYTNEGWKLFKDLNKSELIATINPNTLELEYQKPFAYIDKEHKGKMIRLYSKNIDISQTLDHRMFVKMTNSEYKKKSSKQYRFITYNDIINPIRTSKTPNEIRNFNKERAYGIVQTINYDNNVVDNIMIGGLQFTPNEYAMLMGYYLSEGSCRREQDYGYQINIAQTKHRVKMLNDLKSIFDKQNINIRENGDNIEFNHKGLCEYLRLCGTRSYNKEIPKEVFTLNKEAINIFIDSYIMGDGSITKSTSLKGQKTESVGKFIFTTSKKIADGLTDIGLRAGYSISYKTIDNTGKKFIIRGKEWESKREIYRISLKNSKVVRRYKIEEFDYDGRVYCVSVPNSTLLVRSNGKVNFSGNCLCRLTCYSSTNPELDTIVVDYTGGYVEELKLDRKDKKDRQKKFMDKFNAYRDKLDNIRTNKFITGTYSEPDNGIYSFDYTLYNNNEYYYQQNNMQELNDRILDIILTKAKKYRIGVEDAKASAMHYIVTTSLDLIDYDFSLEDFRGLSWTLMERFNYLNELMYELNNLENWLIETNEAINDLLLKIETNNQQAGNQYDVDIDTYDY